MKTGIKNIDIGIGLGHIKFGINGEQLKELIGVPDEIEEYTFMDDEDMTTEDWHYDDLDLSVSFDEEEGLVGIGVSSPDYELGGESLIGKNREHLVESIHKMGIEDLVYEDVSSSENPNQKLITSDDAGVNFWLENGILTEIQWGALFDE